MVLFVCSRRNSSSERLFFDSSAVKKRTVIPVVGETLLVLLNKEATACAHVNVQLVQLHAVCNCLFVWCAHAISGLRLLLGWVCGRPEGAAAITFVASQSRFYWLLEG